MWTFVIIMTFAFSLRSRPRNMRALVCECMKSHCECMKSNQLDYVCFDTLWYHPYPYVHWKKKPKFTKDGRDYMERWSVYFLNVLSDILRLRINWIYEHPRIDNALLSIIFYVFLFVKTLCIVVNLISLLDIMANSNKL